MNIHFWRDQDIKNISDGGTHNGSRESFYIIEDYLFWSLNVSPASGHSKMGGIESTTFGSNCRC